MKRLKIEPQTSVPIVSGGQTIIQDEAATKEAVNSIIDAYTANQPDPAAASTPAWTVNAATGADNAPNGGVLKTLKEFFRRVGEGPITTSIVVTIVGDLGAGDDFYLEHLDTDTFAHNLTIQGTPRVASTLPPLTAVTPINHAAANDCAQYVTIAGHNWAAEVGKLVRIAAGGSFPGALAWIDQDMGAGRARTSPFMAPPGFAAPSVSPAIGDVLEVLTLSDLHNLTIDTNNLEVLVNFCKFSDVTLDGHYITGTNIQSVQFSSCDFGMSDFTFAAGPTTIDLFGCQFSIFFTVANQITAWGCHDIGFLGFGFQGSGTWDGDSLMNGCTLRWFGSGPGSIMQSCGFLGVYNGNGAAVVASQGAQGEFDNNISSADSVLYGDAAYNVDVHRLGQVLYAAAAQFKVAVSVANFVQSGVNVAALPAPLDAHLNAIVLTA
jgi:hypothetical protein